ncbi:MAG: alpha/beta hydrolase [Dysgonomonas sp.]|nr:alpha/beta hydrolase [Dysgonomonas sp.]
MEKEIQKAPDFLQDPHLSVETKEGLKALNSGQPVETLSIEEARKVLQTAQAGAQVDLSGIEESEKQINSGDYSIKLNIVRPKGVKGKLPVFIFIHGGGWVLGDYPTHKRLVRDLVVESGFASVFVNYTPSPEAHYPQAINEIYAATKWVADHGDEIDVDSSKLAIVGNSVGGNMSLVTSLMAKKKGGPDIKLQILLWPIVDANFDTVSYKKYGEQRFLTTSLMKWMFDKYTTSQQERKEIYVSPLQASIEDLRGLPPTLIEVAENDVLRDEAEALGRKLDEAGVDVTTVRFNGVIHDFGMLNIYSEIPQTRTLITFSAATLKKYLK